MKFEYRKLESSPMLRFIACQLNRYTIVLSTCTEIQLRKGFITHSYSWVGDLSKDEEVELHNALILVGL